MASVWGPADEEDDDIDTLGRGTMTSKVQTWKGSKMIDKRLASRRPDQSLAGKAGEMSLDDMSRWEIEPEEIELGQKLGGGAFGTVYRGRLRGKEVAIKRLNTQEIDEEALDSFRKEVAVMSKLRHPNALLFMGACTTPGNLMIVMELMPRGSVHDLIRKEQVSFKRKMMMAKEAALGMNWLHCSKPAFIHRDLKAGNLLVDQNYTVKVADFGLAHMKESVGEGSFGTMGTPLWMAPEVLEQKEYDESADLYSFGILLWELVTQKDPYGDMPPNELLEQVCKNGVRPEMTDAEFPPRLQALIKRCWDPDPKKRPRFDAILPEFDLIVLEHSIKDNVGREFWRAHFLDKEDRFQDKVSWKVFGKAFCAHFNKSPLPPDDPRFRCLKELTCTSKDEMVNIETWGNLLEWFGPLVGFDQLLDDIVNLLKEAWFHGDLSAADAEKRIATFQKKKGSFLVRFSSREPGSYAITVMSASGKLKHYRVYHKPGLQYLIGKMECASLHEIINNYGAELLLEKPCPGSPFADIFAAKKDISVGYLVPSFD